MLFNSLEFLIFLPLVLLLYFVLPHRLRWILLLAVSYFFYACWKIEYLLLLVATTLIIYISGLMIANAEQQSQRKRYLWIGVICNLGILFLFKYFNFFQEVVRGVFSIFDISYTSPGLFILLPVGLSFYTFQALSYTIDIYRRKRAPERHLGIVALYVSFFPQVLAGPIERSTRLLPQFRQKWEFHWDEFRIGFLLMLWGYFQKVVIADRLAIYVNRVYSEPNVFHGTHVLIATLFFPMQLYCDFAGYSNIAIGVAQMMGFKLMSNFDRPFASRSVPQFFARWHASLTRWMLDYVYSPLAKRVTTVEGNHLVMILVMILIWLWHGASWNFLLIGTLWGIFMVLSNVRANSKAKQIGSAAGEFPDGRMKRVARIVAFYLLFAFVAGVLFRSGSFSNAYAIWNNLFHDLEFSRKAALMRHFSLYEMSIALAAIVLLQVLEWVDHRYQFIKRFPQLPIWLQYSTLHGLIFCILMFGEFNRQPFIYFQF